MTCAHLSDRLSFFCLGSAVHSMLLVQWVNALQQSRNASRDIIIALPSRGAHPLCQCECGGRATSSKLLFDSDA